MMLLAIAITAGLALAWRAARAHGPHRLAWRYLSGHSLDGHARTDAGWVRPGVKVLHPTGHASRWAHLPRLHRAAIRTTAIAGAVMLGWGLAARRAATIDVAAAVTAAMLGAGTWRGIRRARDWRAGRTSRAVTVPLAVALAPIADTSAADAQRSITLRAGWQSAREGEIGSITFPPKFAATPDQRRAVEHLVSSRLPVDADFAWRTRERPQRLQLLAAPALPKMVAFGELRAAMAACKPGQVVIGLDRHGRIYHGSFIGDDPHWGFSVGSGRGKSTMLQVTAAQLLHQEPGASITGIDPKMASLDPLAGVPGVILANDPRDIGRWDRDTGTYTGGMWGTIDAFHAEMMRRLEALKADPTARFPIAVLMLDETNMFAAMTLSQWRAMRESGDPSAPPIWMKIAAILWMGRAVRCHVIMVGQRLDDKATGGIGLRDSLGFRGLAGFRKQQWDMLIGTTPVPRSQRPKGRWIYSDGQAETWVQNVYATPAEVRAYALEGRRAGVRDESGHAVPPGPGTSSRTDGQVWIIGLRAAADHLGLTVAAFEKRRQRAGGRLPGELRRGNQPAWSTDDLTAFAAGDASRAG